MGPSLIPVVSAKSVSTLVFFLALLIPFIPWGDHDQLPKFLFQAQTMAYYL